MFSRFMYGVCYYPEAWDARRHASDIRRIADAGFDYVRMGEGAWSYWEPREGEFQFDLFDRVIDLCRKHRVKVILGTPTYAAPAWVASQYPQTLRWNFNRTPMKHGSRRIYNYTSKKYLELSDRIVTALAEHYRGNDSVVAWQLDNEFNCHMDVSYAPSDTQAFRLWLKEKYRTISRLNDAWGTRFWSQTYDDWGQIELPHPTAAPPNPSQLLDESRFISAMVVRFAAGQASILRRMNRRWLITHNGLFNNVDGPKLVKKLDFFSHDQYPLFNAEGDWPACAQPLAQARSLSFPFGILEQQSGPGGQLDYLHRTPCPGEMRLWAWQSVAHGAKLLSWFRWRTCPYGAEQHWHGLLDADDKDTRRLQEARQFGRELKKLPRELFDAAPVKVAAVLRDFDNEINDRRINTYARSAAGEIGRWYAQFAQRHIPVDMVWPGTELKGYRVLVAGHFKIIDRAMVKRLESFVRGGGTLILGAQSGLKDVNCHIVEQPPPGLLRRLAGVEVEDWTTLSEGQARSASLVRGAGVSMTAFVERLRPTRAEVMARWTGDDPLLGNSPAITRNKLGKGTVIYVGAYLNDAAIAELIGGMELQPIVHASPQVEAIARKAGKGSYLLLMNHSRQTQKVTGLTRARMRKDLLTGRAIRSDELELAPHAVAVMRG